MKRSVILLAMSCVVALAQDQTLTPQPEAWRWQAWENAMRFPTKPRILLTGQSANACAVPLLAVPVDPQLGAKMPVLKPPAKPLEEMPEAEGLPVCPPVDR